MQQNKYRRSVTGEPRLPVQGEGGIYGNDPSPAFAGMPPQDVGLIPTKFGEGTMMPGADTSQNQMRRGVIGNDGRPVRPTTSTVKTSKNKYRRAVTQK